MPRRELGRLQLYLRKTQADLEIRGNQQKHRNATISINRLTNRNLCWRNLEKDGWHYQQARCIPPQMFEDNPWHILERPRHKRGTDENGRNTGPIHDIVTERRRRFAGHVLRMPDGRPARVAMTWMPSMGKRKKGRPKRPGDRRFEKTSTRWA